MMQLESMQDELSNLESESSVEIIENRLSEIIESNEIDTEEKTEQIISVLAKETIHRGPLPSPDQLQKYNEIPGMVDTISSMAVNEQKHRHEMEEKMIYSQAELSKGQLKYIDGSISIKKRQQIYGFIVVILLILVATYCIVVGKDMQGFILFVPALGSFAGMMFFGKHDKTISSNDHEREIE